MTKFKKSRLICPYILEGKDVKNNKFRWNIITSVNYETFNAVYLLLCTKESCRGKEQFCMREAEEKDKNRVCEHLGDINTKKNQPAGHHLTCLDI